MHSTAATKLLSFVDKWNVGVAILFDKGADESTTVNDGMDDASTIVDVAVLFDDGMHDSSTIVDDGMDDSSTIVDDGMEDASTILDDGMEDASVDNCMVDASSIVDVSIPFDD